MTVRTALLFAWLGGCGRVQREADADADTDTDTDAGTDADVDSDTDTGTETDTQSDPCLALPEGCWLLPCGSSRCVITCGGEETWSAARDACAAWGGCLVTLGDQAENDCIADQIPVTWIGLRQDESGSEPTEGWIWECGASGFWNWESVSSQPDDTDGTADCAILDSTAAWNDLPCDWVNPYVCEVE